MFKILSSRKYKELHDERMENRRKSQEYKMELSVLQASNSNLSDRLNELEKYKRDYEEINGKYEQLKEETERDLNRLSDRLNELEEYKRDYEESKERTKQDLNRGIEERMKELGIAGDMTLEEIERAYILHKLKQCDYNQKLAAEKLGIGRTTLWRKLTAYKVSSTTLACGTNLVDEATAPPEFPMILKEGEEPVYAVVELLRKPEKVCINGQTSVDISESHIQINFPPDGIPFELIEEKVLKAALEITNWRLSQAARLLNMSRDTLRYRVSKFVEVSFSTVNLHTECLSASNFK